MTIVRIAPELRQMRHIRIVAPYCYRQRHTGEGEMGANNASPAKSGQIRPHVEYGYIGIEM